jgi:3-deoxy-D-manno-octulosonic-acid transferase
MYLLYSVLYTGALLLSVPYFLYRSLREPGFGRSLVERVRGPASSADGARTIWIHAVSVGEAITALTLVRRLGTALPDAKVVLSVTTPTGRKVAEERLGSRAAVFYCPFDLAVLVRRAMRRIRPAALVVIETEFWPHLFREARRAGAAVLLVNGRISDRSFPGYSRIRFFIERFLAPVDRFLMQNELYASRAAALGAKRETIRVVGSLKFDGVPEETVAIGRLTPPDRIILIGGSTLHPEEEILLRVFERMRGSVPALLLVLAPRHASRFEEVSELARARGLAVARRTRPESAPSRPDVLVLDTLGELASVYAEADYVFVGGSLASWGGHNIIEPASKGKPVLFGPHMQNFADIARLFLDAGAAIQVESEADLENALGALLARPERTRELSRNALRVVEENRGAVDRTVREIEELMG